MPPYLDMCDTATSSPVISTPSQPLHKQLLGSNSELVRLAAKELESMRNCNNPNETYERSFPPACLRLLRLIEGNDRCADCAAPSPDWAGVTYGATLCLHCSGLHRGLGVGLSVVKSLSMDSWKRREVLSMLEGGNGQLSDFFERHGVVGVAVAGNRRGRTSAEMNAITDRYRTNAASFYRHHLMGHARGLAERDGPYEGREASRRRKKKKNSSSKGRRSRKLKPEHLKLPTVKERHNGCGESADSSDSSVEAIIK